MKINGDEGAKLLIKKYPEYFFKLSVSDEGVLKDIDDVRTVFKLLKMHNNIKLILWDFGGVLLKVL